MLDIVTITIILDNQHKLLNRLSPFLRDFTFGGGMRVWGPPCSSGLEEFGLVELRGPYNVGVRCATPSWQLSQYSQGHRATAGWDPGQGRVGAGDVGRVVLR